MSAKRPNGSPRSKPHSAQAGYTLIEVLVAIGILAAGSVGIVAMQQASTRGNIEARDMTAATQVTRTWVERIRRDALLWNTQGVAGPFADPGPDYLSNVPEAADGVGAWFTPSPPEGSSDSYAFDYWGRDTTEGDAMVYCTHVRLNWVTPGESMRADVRTFWHRRGRGTEDGLSDRRLFPDCGSGSEDEVSAELGSIPSRLHAVYASTLIRWQPLP